MNIQNTINEIMQRNAEYQSKLDALENERLQAALKDAEKRARFKKGNLVTAELNTHKRPQVVMITKVYYVNDTIEDGHTWHQEDYEIMLQTGQLRHWSLFEGTHPDIRESYIPQLIKKAQDE
jgi:hypothetical protein